MSYQPSAWLQEQQARGKARYALPTLFNDNTLPDEEARQAVRWCYERNAADFEETDREFSPIVLDITQWTEDYFFQQKSALNLNFSLERFEHLVDVRDHLRKTGNPRFQRIEKKAQPQGRGTNNAVNPFQEFPLVLLLGVGVVGIFLLLLISRLFNR